MARTLRMTDQELAGIKTRQPGSTAAPSPRSTPAPAASAATPNKKRLQALGRLPKGTMNKTEARYAELLAMQVLAGEVAWWKFEGMTLHLAPKTTIRIDFNVMMANGEFRLVDVKGSLKMIEDDAHAKMKIAADMYPFAFFYAVPRGRTGHAWDVTPV